MSKPLYRGLSGGNGRTSGDSWSEDLFDKSYQHKDFSKNGFGHELPSPVGNSRNRQNLKLTLLKLGLALIGFVALWGSICWITYISTASQGTIYRRYRHLQERLITDLSVVGELSHGVGKLKELEFCPPEYESYVPCYYNVSESLDSTEADGKIEYQRQCVQGSAQGISCLVLPPRNYRIPLRWPTGRDFIWKENVKITGQEFSSGSLTKRMMVEEEHISFHSESLMVDGVEDYSHQIAEMIGLRNESNFNEAGVRTVLDIGCGFGSFGAHLFSKQLLTMCIANYETSGSQVQLTLERGLPAMIGSFTSKQLPYPHLSFDMVHCARCGIDWENNDGILLVEIDRLLRPGGYFVWTSLRNTHRSLRDKDNQKKWTLIRDFSESLCWEILSQQDETVIWKKTSKKKCYNSRGKAGPPFCGKSHDIESPYYKPLNPCIGGLRSQRWIPIENRTPWPSQVNVNSAELRMHGVHQEDFMEDSLYWNSAVRNYWSLLSPIIFSDHPKRPGDEDPSPPFNMLRNVLDMNSQFGGFNAALFETGKSVWVMNVVPATSHNLPLIFDRGFIGVQHDWCEAFPTYPRTYDMVLAKGLLSTHPQQRCPILDIFLEIDRILRPEGWVVIHDKTPFIEALRSVTTQLRWEARMVEMEANKDERLLVCQKPFFRKQLQ